MTTALYVGLHLILKLHQLTSLIMEEEHECPHREIRKRDGNQRYGKLKLDHPHRKSTFCLDSSLCQLPIPLQVIPHIAELRTALTLWPFHQNKGNVLLGFLG